MNITNKKKQLKNWITKYIFLFVIFFCQTAGADEIFRFTKITCIPELNYFDASLFDINGGSDEELDFMSENQKELQVKYGLVPESSDGTQECKLKDSNIKIQIKYRSAKINGFCGGAPDAMLKLWIDQKLIIDLDHFNSCLDKDAIVHVGFKDFKRIKKSILYFKERNYKRTKTKCVIWLDSELKGISSNYCNRSEINRNLPIKDNHIIKPLTNDKY